MKYKVEVQSEDETVKTEIVRDKHPKEAIKQVVDDTVIKDHTKEVDIHVTNKSGSFWIYKMKFMEKAKKWKGKLVKSISNFFDSMEVDEIFKNGKSALFMAKRKAEKANEEFQKNMDVDTQEDENPQQNEKKQSKEVN